MTQPSRLSNHLQKILHTPVSQLLRGRITGPQCPLDRMDASKLPESVVQAIQAITAHFTGYRQTKIAKQLVKTCQMLIQEGRDETHLVAQLNEPDSIASLIRLTKKTDWILSSPLPASLWPTVESIIGNRRVRAGVARKMLLRVSRSLQWQLESGQTPEALGSKYGEAISISELLYETKSPSLLLADPLPEPVASVILDVVQRTRLREYEKSDTAQELSAHFVDGLEKGRTSEELIADFGSPKVAARLIRRACLRNRSFAWRAWRRTWQVSAVVIVLWTLLAMRFLSATPTVTFDIIQEVDNLSRAIPEQERAWPLYRDGLISLRKGIKPQTAAESYGMNEGLTLGPKSKHWSKAKKFLTDRKDIINLFEEAAKHPKLGFINHDPENSDWFVSEGFQAHYELNPPDLVGFEMLLPQAQALSSEVGALLKGAFYLALESGDSERCLQLLLARLAVAEHYRQSGPFVICQVGANAITSSIAQDIAKLVSEQPDFFNDEQASTLFKKLSETELKPLNLASSDTLLKDYVQKIYTDDGSGNGRFTAEGFPIMQRMNGLMQDNTKLKLLEFLVSDSGQQKTEKSDSLVDTASQALFAPVAAMFADRKELEEKLLFMNELLWKQRTEVTTSKAITDSEYLTEYRRILESPSLRLKYLPAIVTLPYEQTTTYWSHLPKNQVKRDAALVILAAELFRRQYGQYPKSAEELVPLFLTEVPIDPFTQKPLRYLINEGRPMIDSFGLKPSEEK